MIWSATVQVAAAQPTPPAIETISPYRVVALQLGGSTPAEKERHYALPLVEKESVIIDLVPVDPTLFRPRPVRPVASATQGGTSQTAASPGRPVQTAPKPFIQIQSPTGQLVRRTPTPATPLAARLINRLPIESAVGDSGVRLGFYPSVAGTYDIRVGYEGGQPVAFELLIRPRTIPPQRRVTVALGQQVDDKLEDGERIYYQFTAPAAEKWISVDMSSKELDSYLDLRGPGNEDAARIESDDDSGDGEGDARILARLPSAGQYTVIARGLSHGGHFRFKIAEFTPPEVHPRPLSEGVTTTGQFQGMPDGIMAGDSGGGYQLYKLGGEAGQRFMISMRSEADGIDPALQIVAAAIASDDASPQDLAIVAENDDSAEEGGLNSRVQIRFNQKGTVLIRAGAKGTKKPRGDYAIAVTLIH
jgi:hypothetical protein